MEIFTLKSTLKQLEDQTQLLCDQLTSHLVVCANRPGPFLTGDRALSLARDIYRNIWVEDQATDARETPVVIGALAADSEALQCAAEINRYKDQLKNQLTELREQLSRGLSRAGSDKAFRRYLSEIGLGRLSLRQVYRHIPILNDSPKSIAFSFSTKGKSVKRILVSEAVNLLQRSGFSGAHIDAQMDRLMELPGHYMLAQVQHLAAYYKANIRYSDGRRETLPVFLPILFPSSSESVMLPDVLHEAQRASKARRDHTLEDTAYIPSLRLYRYQGA